MGVATVAFRKCIINNSKVDEADHDDEAWRVVFDLDIEGESYKNVYVEVRQPNVPDGHETPLEISTLHGYCGQLNYEVLRGSIEFYFCQATGGKGSVLSRKDKFFPLNDWTIEQEMVVQFEMPENEGRRGDS